MEYNQDTGLASVSVSGGEGRGRALTVAVPHISIRWRYESGGGDGDGVAAAMGLRGVDGGVRAFSSTVTYGPFSRDYIQLPDLARKRRLGSPNVA